MIPVHTSLTCSLGQSAWALSPSLFGELLASCKKKELFRCVPCNLVPLGMSWYVALVQKRGWRTSSLVSLSCCSCLLLLRPPGGSVPKYLGEDGWCGVVIAPSWAPFLCVARAVAVGSVGVVVAIVIMGRFCCLSLLLTKSSCRV